jgi:hypothetical protein
MFHPPTVDPGAGIPGHGRCERRAPGSGRLLPLAHHGLVALRVRVVPWAELTSVWESMPQNGDFGTSEK